MAGPASASGSIWQVRVIQSLSGIEVVNVLHFITPQGADDMDVRLIAKLVSCYVTHIIPAWPTSYTLKEIRYQMMSANPPGLEYSYAVNQTGQVTGEILPTFNSGVVSLRTNVGGRSGRGRMYIAGLLETATSGNLIAGASAQWTALLNFLACCATAFITAADPPPANFVRWVVYSRKLGGAKVPYTVGGCTPVVTATASDLIGTTRSRKQGHGP